MQLKIDAAAFRREIASACKAASSRVEAAALNAVEVATDGLKRELREQTEASLGHRIAFAWRSEIYPNTDTGDGPAGFVWSKAPKIVDFWSAERVRTPVGGFFAIPVNPVIKRGGRAMSIAEVETKFNQDLQPVRLPSGNLGLFADLVQGKSKRRRGFRQATKGRLAQGRRAEKVLMFVLVRTLRSRKLIDITSVANKWAAQVPAIIDRTLDRDL